MNGASPWLLRTVYAEIITSETSREATTSAFKLPMFAAVEAAPAVITTTTATRLLFKVLNEQEPEDTDAGDGVVKPVGQLVQLAAPVVD